MLHSLTHESFAKYIHHVCPVHGGPGNVELELVECRKLGAPCAKASRREPFILLFRGPHSPVLPQRIYAFDFSELGTLEIFIVPVGPDGTGMQYEAIFT